MLQNQNCPCSQRCTDLQCSCFSQVNLFCDGHETGARSNSSNDDAVALCVVEWNCGQVELRFSAQPGWCTESFLIKSSNCSLKRLQAVEEAVCYHRAISLCSGGLFCFSIYPAHCIAITTLSYFFKVSFTRFLTNKKNISWYLTYKYKEFVSCCITGGRCYVSHCCCLSSHV